jgi:ABC-type glycerol-3-phosphate transport system permease component
MTALAIIVLYPIFFAVNSAFKNPATFAHDRLAPAIPPAWDSLLKVAAFIDLPQSLTISFVVSSAATVLVWVIAGLAAFGFTKT